MNNHAVTDTVLEALRGQIFTAASHDERNTIVSTGRFYVDGDAVEVFVRLNEDGTRVVVSDGGITTARRSLYGVESLARSAGKLWQDILFEFGVETISDRVFARGSTESLPHLIGLVADASIALDSVRLLAENARQTFSDKLEKWLLFQGNHKLAESRTITDRHGDVQKFTAIVESPRGAVAIQGAGASSGGLRQAAEHAYFLFSGLDEEAWPVKSRLIVLEKLNVKTDPQIRSAKSLVSRLTEQAYVATFEGQLTLNRFLTEEPGNERDLATLTFGQTDAGDTAS